jgi:hypothetical protein
VSVNEGRIVYDGAPEETRGDWEHGDVDAHPHDERQQRARPSGLGLTGG